ncbi:cobalamin biosynthesis protein CbiX [Methylomonas lenta]|uniref:Cobalamin biosynthesis protein CbiX n=1 Tax=Methylomonas lenta TaxID=980561 RepID=A0A177NUD0_9GAMM|nr:CbiX/SirB N-terminal domain-containing protein [Methylomonas lenta]OAI20690.1 cobalamin biosynthesis protein CbiX [Methylomonas lenta]
MTHLLVLAHGSRREASNNEISELVARLRYSCKLFAGIDYAFLEIAKPFIHEAQQIAQGAVDIVVLAYFLSAGRHVVTDIPEQVEQVSVEIPNIKNKIAHYLGASEKIDALLIHQAFTAYH